MRVRDGAGRRGCGPDELRALADELAVFVSNLEALAVDLRNFRKSLEARLGEPEARADEHVRTISDVEWERIDERSVAGHAVFEPAGELTGWQGTNIKPKRPLIH